MKIRETVDKISLPRESHLEDRHEEIDFLIEKLIKAKSNGATHLLLEAFYLDSNVQRFRLDASKIITVEELKLKRISMLKKEIEELEA